MSEEASYGSTVATEGSSTLMKRRDAIKEDETSAILSTLGFSDYNSNSNSADSNSSTEESEKHTHALKIIVANGTVKYFLGKILTYEDLDSPNPKQLKKYYELFAEEEHTHSFFTK